VAARVGWHILGWLTK